MFYSDELSRLGRIAWQNTGASRQAEDLELVKDFLARCARLLQRHSVTSADPLITPRQLFGVAFKLDAAMEREIKNVASAAPNLLVRWVAQRHLSFCLAADAGFGQALELVGLYDPLIRLFARGGCIDKHHHEMIVSGRYAISTFNWQERFSSPTVTFNAR
ncbi:MAG: hypothetical protein ACREHD_06710 [Pirellulales bacterium]